MNSFIAREFGVLESEAEGYYSITISDSRESPKYWIQLQKSLDPDEDDIALFGSDYCIVVGSAATSYGCLSEVHVSTSRMLLKFTPGGAVELGLNQEENGAASIQIELEMSLEESARFRIEIGNFFEDGRRRQGLQRPAVFMDD